MGKCTGFSLLHWLHLIPTLLMSYYHPGCPKLTLFCMNFMIQNCVIFQVQGAFNHCLQDEIIEDFRVMKKTWGAVACTMLYIW